jgi:hypothetical protein
MAKKTGKSNLGPEMAKKAHEAKVSGLKPFNPDWDEKPQRQQTIFGDDKPYQVKKVKPGKTVVGPLAGRPARGGMGGGIGFPNSANQ